MPLSIRTSKQYPVAIHDRPSQHPAALKNVNNTSSSSSSIPPCDKSTATCSTTELSFSSFASSSASFTKLSSSKNTTNSTIPQPQQAHRKCSPSKTLNRPVTLHPQSSLLDMTMDESHDDDTSFSISPHKPSKSSPSPRKQIHSHNPDVVGTSIIEQTEKNLAAISESMTGSFCANQDNVNNTCTTMLPDCTNTNHNNTFKNDHSNRLFGDTLVQNRLLDDFNYLLGSNVMPCCEEKTIFSSCFGISSFTCSTYHNYDGPVHDEFLNRDDESKVRNRAGESWRARAYRIRKLREERMMKQDHTSDQVYGGHYNSYYSLTNRRQVSMERALGKSHSADGRIDNTNPFHSVKRDLFHSGGSVEVESAGCGGGIIGGESSRRPKHEVQSDPLGRMIGDCIDPIAPARDDAVELEVVWKQNDSDLCYDSDPGETSFRRSLNGGGMTGDFDEEEKSAMNSTPKKFMGRNKSLKTKVNFGRRRRNPYSSLDCNEEKLDLSASFDVHVSFDDDSDDEDDYSYDSISPEKNRPWFGKSPKLHQVRTKALEEDEGIRQNVQVSFKCSLLLSAGLYSKLISPFFMTPGRSK